MEFMTHLFYYRLLTCFLGNFSGKVDLLMLCGDIESNPGPRQVQTIGVLVIKQLMKAKNLNP